MSPERYSPEKVIGMLREAKAALSQGITVGEMGRQLSISKQTYCRLGKQNRGMNVSLAKGLKDIERENVRVKILRG